MGRERSSGDAEPTDRPGTLMTIEHIPPRAGLRIRNHFARNMARKSGAALGPDMDMEIGRKVSGTRAQCQDLSQCPSSLSEMAKEFLVFVLYSRAQGFSHHNSLNY